MSPAPVEEIVEAKPGDAIISSATGRILLNVKGKLQLFKEGAKGEGGGSKLSAPREVREKREKETWYTPSATHDAIVAASWHKKLAVGPVTVQIYVDGVEVINSFLFNNVGVWTFPVKASGTWLIIVKSKEGEGPIEYHSTYWFWE